MWELDHQESWVMKNWCFWTEVLEKTLESPLDSIEIQLVNPKGDQPWIFIGRTDAEAPICWPSDEKSQLIVKDPDAGQHWRQEEMGKTEDELVGRHHWLDGQEFEQAPGVGAGQGNLACCSPWGHKESDTTEWLTWTEVQYLLRKIIYTSTWVSECENPWKSTTIMLNILDRSFIVNSSLCGFLLDCDVLPN